MTAPRVALVTGAGSGIGRAVALALSGDGFHVALLGRRAAELDHTAAAAPATGGRLLPIPTDITDPAQVAAAFARVQKEFGRLDLLFNNAGVGAPAVPMEDLELEHWHQAVSVNLTGAFLCAREAIRLMKAQTPKGGRIINNGSISAHTPRPYSAPYTATKHAISGLTKSIALDCRAHGITCGQIDIGNAATEMTSRMSGGVLQADFSLKAEPTMDLANVARSVLAMANMSPDATVLFMTVMTNAMPYVGRG
jgi:NAD(P)-dependent dehydrogenase (short-subunit alcohol dehydrogenase family)